MAAPSASAEKVVVKPKGGGGDPEPVGRQAGQPSGSDSERHEQTHWFTDFLVDHPYVVSFGALVFVLFCVLLWTSVVNATVSDDGGNFTAYREVETRRYYAFENSEQSEDITPVPQQSQTVDDFTMTVYYTVRAGRGSNIFTREGLLAIFDTEAQIVGNADAVPAGARRARLIEDYEENCQLLYSAVPGSNGTALEADGCRPPKSVITDVFFPGAASVTRADVEALDDATILARLEAGSTAEALAAGNDFFFSRDFSGANSSSPRYDESYATRSLVFFGVPVRSRGGLVTGPLQVSAEFPYFTDENDDAQEDRHLGFVKQYTSFFEGSDPDGFVINYAEGVLSVDEIGALIDGDFVLIGFAAVFIYLWLVFGTGSAFLGTAALLSILMAYPVALTVYHGVLQIEVDTRFNQVAIYVVLGIGADDAFVFADAWAQLRSEDESSGHDGWSLHSRMRHAWARAASAMLVTTSTTFMAFIMTATSPLPGIAVFGIVSGLLVLFVYINVITFFAACVVIYENNFHKMRVCCCLGRGSKDAAGTPEDGGAAAAGAGAASKPDGGGKIGGGGGDDGDGAREESVSRSARNTADFDVSKYRAMDRFFYNRLAPFLFRYRFIFVAIMTSAAIAGIVGFANLEVPEVLEFGLPDEAEISKAFNLGTREFPPAKDSQFSHKSGMFWGVNPNSPVDRSDLDWNDLSNWGSLKLDPSPVFEFNNDTQNYIISVCEDLRTATASDGSPVVTGLSCVPELLKEWEAFTNFSDPALRSYDATWSGSALELDYSERMVALRLQDFFDYEVNGTFPYGGDLKKNVGGILGVPADEVVRVDWVRVLIDLTLPQRYNQDELDFWFRYWAGKMVEINENAPANARRGMQGSLPWAEKVANDKLVSSTYSSVFISYSVAVVIMLIATRNATVTALASLCLLFIVLTSMGFFVALGRTLGIVESVVSIVLVGLAVDFTVHIAHAYNSCELSGRYERTRSAVFEILGSITLGAATTMSAALMLLFAVLPFFVTFGTFILVTIAFSMLFAVFFFVPLLMIVGPLEKPSGDLDHLWRTYAPCAKSAGPAPPAASGVDLQEMPSRSASHEI